MLDGGTITPFNKGPAIPGSNRDTRPIKEDDCFGWIRACHRNASGHLRAIICPEKLFIYVRSGVEMMVTGAQLFTNQEKQATKNTGKYP
jgi:hypothetical protein